MPSTFAWVDFAEEDRQKMLNLVHLFSEQDTRDELGIGTIRDAFADYFFPGTSTIQTRARYMLFVPWIYRDLEKKKVPSARIKVIAREREIRLIYALIEGEQKEGLIGRDAKSTLQRLPSNIYWTGLYTWGIRFFPGTQNQYHHYLDRYYLINKLPVIENDDAYHKTSIRYNWHPGLPNPPKDLFDIAVLDLSKEEAIYLRDQILIHCRDSMLAKLVLMKRMTKISYPWEHPIVPSLDPVLQGNLVHARNFSEIIHGAALIYNLLLSKSSHDDELIDSYNEKLNDWKLSIKIRWNELVRWYNRIDMFWKSEPLGQARIPLPTNSFVNQWMKMVFETVGLRNVVGNKSVDNLITYRESQLKGKRSRLQNPRALEMWRGASGSRQLDYRWRNVAWFLEDILSGLRRKKNHAES